MTDRGNHGDDDLIDALQSAAPTSFRAPPLAAIHRAVRRRRATRRVVATAGLLIVAIASVAVVTGDGGQEFVVSDRGRPTTTATTTTTTGPVTVDLGVFEIEAGAAEAVIEVVIGGSSSVEGGCVWAVPAPDDPDQRPIPIEWPNGWTATFTTDASDETFTIAFRGETLAAEGDRLEVIAVDWGPFARRCQSISDRSAFRLFRVNSNLGPATAGS